MLYRWWYLDGRLLMMMILKLNDVIQTCRAQSAITNISTAFLRRIKTRKKYSYRFRYQFVLIQLHWFPLYIYNSFSLYLCCYFCFLYWFFFTSAFVFALCELSELVVILRQPRFSPANLFPINENYLLDRPILIKAYKLITKLH